MQLTPGYDFCLSQSELEIPYISIQVIISVLNQKYIDTLVSMRARGTG